MKQTSDIEFINIDFRSFWKMDCTDHLFYFNQFHLFIYKSGTKKCYMIDESELYHNFHPNVYLKNGIRKWNHSYRPPISQKMELNRFYNNKWQFILYTSYEAEEYVGVGKDGNMARIEKALDLITKKEIDLKLLRELTEKHYGHEMKYDSIIGYVSAMYSITNSENYCAYTRNEDLNI